MTKLRDLERRLKEEPENLGLRVAVAGALREAGRHADAVELYRSVAIAYRDQGRTQQAIAVCRSILEVAPDDARCQALLATLLASSDLLEAGIPSLVPAGTESSDQRSWHEETPLPPALPHHIADPTTRLRRVSEAELPTADDGPTIPGSEPGTLPEIELEVADAVPDARGDAADDDQTVPRELPLGIRRPRP